MLINFSNHPYSDWSLIQKTAAEIFGKCVDLPFPQVDSMGDESYVRTLCTEYVQSIEQLADQEEIVVHIMGEMTFICLAIQMLQQRGIKCIASTTERIVTKLESGKIKSAFQFSRFREYQRL